MNLEGGLKSQQLLLKRRQEAENSANIRLRHSIGKHDKPFTEGNFIKDCMIAALEGIHQFVSKYCGLKSR